MTPGFPVLRCRVSWSRTVVDFRCDPRPFPLRVVPPYFPTVQLFLAGAMRALTRLCS